MRPRSKSCPDSGAREESKCEESKWHGRLFHHTSFTLLPAATLARRWQDSCLQFAIASMVGRFALDARAHLSPPAGYGMLLTTLYMHTNVGRRWVSRSTADAIEGSGWGGPLANGVRGGAAAGQPPLPPLTPLRATNSGIPHYDIPGGEDQVNSPCSTSL